MKKLRMFCAKFFSVLLGTLIILRGTQAWAYIPPSQYIVKSWVNKHSGLKALKLRSTVTALILEKPTPIHFKATVVYRRDTQKLKSWATDDFDKVLYSTERDLSSMSPLSKILFLSDVKEIVSTLQSQGVPIQTDLELLKYRTEVERRAVEQESLVRWNGVVAWVLGYADSKKEPEGPQLWFEKDLFLPVRFLFRGAVGGELYDIHLDNYKFMREFPFPRNISLHKKGGGTVLSEQWVDLLLNSDVQATPGIREMGFTELGNASSIELQNLIQTYYDIVR
jgi:hypothetical protein